MIRVNLLPVRAARRKESIRQQFSIAGLSLLLLFIIMGGLYWGAASKISALDEDIKSGEAELRTLNKKVGELAKIKEQKKLVMEKLRVVNELEARRKGPVKLFQKISAAIPEKAWITSLKETSGGVTLKGFATTEEVVADFMRGLERFPDLGRVELDIVNKVKKGSVPHFSFTIRLVKSKGGA